LNRHKDSKKDLHLPPLSPLCYLGDCLSQEITNGDSYTLQPNIQTGHQIPPTLEGQATLYILKGGDIPSPHSFDAYRKMSP